MEQEYCDLWWLLICDFPQILLRKAQIHRYICDLILVKQKILFLTTVIGPRGQKVTSSLLEPVPQGVYGKQGMGKYSAGVA